MLVALKTKNKDKFVLGTFPCPSIDDILQEAWRRCNKIVINWLTRLITSSIKQSVMSVDSAFEIWTNLQQRFCHGDKF